MLSFPQHKCVESLSLPSPWNWACRSVSTVVVCCFLSELAVLWGTEAMLGVLGHGAGAPAVGGAASSWEESLSAGLTQLWVCASLDHLSDAMSGSPQLVRGAP